jgi:hypothetical protein
VTHRPRRSPPGPLHSEYNGSPFQVSRHA